MPRTLPASFSQRFVPFHVKPLLGREGGRENARARARYPLPYAELDVIDGGHRAGHGRSLSVSVRASAPRSLTPGFVYKSKCVRGPPHTTQDGVGPVQSCGDPRRAHLLTDAECMPFVESRFRATGCQHLLLRFGQVRRETDKTNSGECTSCIAGLRSSTFAGSPADKLT